MARLIGVDLPRDKRLEVALTYIFGVGRTRALATLEATQISGDLRVHQLTDEHLVVRSGSLGGRRDIVQRTGIIGWNLQQSWFQRRAGLVTLVATTAAGTQAYAAIDVPESLAIALAHDAVPGLVEPFLA